jgi:hypothetical protein
MEPVSVRPQLDTETGTTLLPLTVTGPERDLVAAAPGAGQQAVPWQTTAAAERERG